MKRYFSAFLLLLSILTNAAIAQTPAAAKRPDYAVPFVNKTLPNGLEVIVLPDPSVPIVTVELAVRNGSFTESPEFHGLSHLYEHMFFKPNMAIVLRDCANLPNRFSVPPICQRAQGLSTRIGDISYLQNANKVSIFNGT